MVKSTIFRAKVCMVGDSGVGKTSLVRRYVLDQFSDEYVSTLGTKVMKKRTSIKTPEGQEIDIMMTVWDIMGEKELVGVVKESYFNGAGGVLAVCDLTRDETLESLEVWLGNAEKVTGKVPVMVAANKLDLIPPRSIKRLSDKLESYSSGRNMSEILTSAKTGENVEIAFKKLASDMVVKTLKVKELDELAEAISGA